MHKLLFYNKFIICLYICELSWLITKIILRCSVRKTSKVWFVCRMFGEKKNLQRVLEVFSLSCCRHPVTSLVSARRFILPRVNRLNIDQLGLESDV